MPKNEQSGRPTGWYYGWNIIAICILAQIAAGGLAIYTFSLFLHGWSTQLHAPVSTMVLGMSSCAIGTAILSPLLGYLVDKYPIRPLFIIGIIATAIFAIGISLMQTTWQYLVLYAVVLPIALSFPSSVPCSALLSRWFVRHRGLALSLSVSAPGLAGAIMPPVVALLLPHFGWRIIWRYTGLLVAVVILPLAIIILRERPTEREGLHYVTDDAETTATQGPAIANIAPLKMRNVFSRRYFWLLLITYLALMAFYGGTGQNLAPIAASKGLTTQTASILLSLFNLAYLAGTLGCGVLSDQLGNRRPLLALGALAAFSGLLLAFGHGVAVLGAGFTLAGLSGAFWPSLAGMVAQEFGQQGFGRAFGMLVFFLPFAAPASFAVAKAQEHTGSYFLPLLILSALASLATIAAFFLREPRHGHMDGGIVPAAPPDLPAFPTVS